jgi:hypothetical protein
VGIGALTVQMFVVAVAAASSGSGCVTSGSGVVGPSVPQWTAGHCFSHSSSWTRAAGRVPRKTAVLLHGHYPRELRFVSDILQTSFSTRAISTQ